jgi:hypothetical protein
MPEFLFEEVAALKMLLKGIETERVFIKIEIVMNEFLCVVE